MTTAPTSTFKWLLRATLAVILGLAATALLVLAAVIVAYAFDVDGMGVLMLAVYMPILSLPMAVGGLSLLVAVAVFVARYFWPRK